MSIRAIVGGCRVAVVVTWHTVAALVLWLRLGAWRSVAVDVGPTRRLAQGGRSQHVAVTNGGDVVVVGDGGRSVCCDCVW